MPNTNIAAIPASEAIQKQAKYMQWLIKDPKRMQFLKYLKEYHSMTYAADLAGITLNSAKKIHANMVRLGLPAPAINTGKGRPIVNNRADMAVQVAQTILENAQDFLNEHYGEYAPNSTSTLGKALIDKALNEMGQALSLDGSAFDFTPR
jgi:hypothetical protein